MCLSPAQLCGPRAHASKPKRRFAAWPHAWPMRTAASSFPAWAYSFTGPSDLPLSALRQASEASVSRARTRREDAGHYPGRADDACKCARLGHRRAASDIVDIVFLFRPGRTVGPTGHRRQREPECGFPIDAAGGLLGSCSAVLWSHASAGRGGAAGVRSVCVPPVLLSMCRQVELSWGQL